MSVFRRKTRIDRLGARVLGLVDDAARADLARQMRAVDRLVRHNPWEALATVALASFLVGKLSAKRKS